MAHTTDGTIFEAAESGDIRKLEAYIKADPSLLEAYSKDGWTALHLAAHYGHVDAARALLLNGANTETRSRNEMKNTPIHAAVAGNRTMMVELLLEHGAEIDVQQHGGWTALHGAAQHGNAEMVELLLEFGANADVASDDGKTAIDIARDAGHDEVAEQIEEYSEA
jgi:ankyrin repeat protein